MLTHFWFPVPGHRGIGVTAASLAQATQLATAVAIGHGWMLDARMVEQNVEVGDLRLDEAVVDDANGPGVVPGGFALQRITRIIEVVFRPPPWAGRVFAQAIAVSAWPVVPHRGVSEARCQRERRER